MVDHVSGAVFAVLASKAVSDYVIKAMVASVANWSRTDIVLKSDGEPSCKKNSGTIQKRAFGADDRTEQSCWKHGSSRVVERMIQEVTGLVQCLGITIRAATAVQLGPSSDLGGQACGLATHVVEELWQDSALHAAWTGVLERNRTLRVRCSTSSVGHKATPTVGGRRPCRRQRTHGRAPRLR